MSFIVTSLIAPSAEGCAVFCKKCFALIDALRELSQSHFLKTIEAYSHRNSSPQDLLLLLDQQQGVNKALDVLHRNMMLSKDLFVSLNHSTLVESSISPQLVQYNGVLFYVMVLQRMQC